MSANQTMNAKQTMNSRKNVNSRKTVNATQVMGTKQIINAKQTVSLKQFLNSVNTLAFRIFGERILKKEEHFSAFKIKLRQAQIFLPAEQYVSTAILISLILGILGGFFSLILGWQVFQDANLETISLNSLNLGISHRFPCSQRIPLGVEILGFIKANSSLILTLIFGTLSFIIITTLSYGLIMAYPPLKAGNRKRAINENMPYATAFLYVLQRGGGMTIFEIMKALSKQPHLYGTTSNEFGNIIQNIEYFGKDLKDALWEAADRTPSENFKDLADGLISIISSGGDITLYLKNKTELYKANANKAHKHFLETLGLLAEVYITVFVVGPLFLMVILVVMSMINNSGPTNLYILVYGVIPFGTAGFLIFLDMLTGEAEKLPEEKSLGTKPDFFSDIRVKPATSEDLLLIKKIEYLEKVSKVKKILFHPIKAMLDKPIYAFAISAQLAIGYFIFAFQKNRPYYGGFVEIAQVLDDHIYFSLLLLFIPYVIFNELKNLKNKQIEEQIPEFLKRLASINGTGILLADAIAITAQSNMGSLRYEIKRTVEDIRWNSNLPEALKRFESRVRTNMTRRSITLIARASESTGNIHQVISTVAQDADIEKNLKKERASEMFIYVFIIFITFFVFLIIVYVLAAFFLPALEGASNPAMSLGGFNLEEYTLLFFHAALLQGFCSGLVAGKMGSGKITSGLKYSLAMMTVSYILFRVFL